VTWFERGESAQRQAICDALPGAAAAQTTAILARGLRDPVASVRATCASTAARQGKRVDRATVRRLVELVRDRDEAARAHAIAALGTLSPGQRPRAAIEDRSASARAAAAIGANEADLRVLVKDKDADVVAAALAALGERAPADVLAAAAVDSNPQVRRAAIAGITDLALLEKLTTDADPDVASAALVRLTIRRGRDASTQDLIKRLLAATPKSLERVRIARAWLAVP
jgi:hypothetical protein